MLSHGYLNVSQAGSPPPRRDLPQDWGVRRVALSALSEMAPRGHRALQAVQAENSGRLQGELGQEKNVIDDYRCILIMMYHCYIYIYIY